MNALSTPCLSVPPLLDEHSLRQSLGGFCTGVCLVSTVGLDGKPEGMTINSFSSVSLSPPLILWSVREAARSAHVYRAAPYFVISVLAADQQALATHFAKPSADKFAAYADWFEAGLGGCPRLKRAVSTYECRLHACYPEGDHAILIGQVERFSHDEQAPLIFHQGRMGSMADLIAPAAKALA